MNILLQTTFTKAIDTSLGVLTTILLIYFFGSFIYGNYQYHYAFVAMIGILNIFHNVAQVHFKDEKNDNLFLSILVNQIVFSLIYFFIILIINFFFSKININIIFFIIILFDQFLSINISLLSVSSLSRGKFLLPNFFLILNRLTQILFILALFIFFEKELKSIFYYLYVMISLKLIFVFIFINNLKLNFVFKNFFFKVYKSDYKKS